jgi:hypothetical protein
MGQYLVRLPTTLPSILTENFRHSYSLQAKAWRVYPDQLFPDPYMITIHNHSLSHTLKGFDYGTLQCLKSFFWTLSVIRIKKYVSEADSASVFRQEDRKPVFWPPGWASIRPRRGVRIANQGPIRYVFCPLAPLSFVRRRK